MIMSRLVLIPGFATNITYASRPRLGGFAGFRAFAPLVKDGTATLFRWGVQTNFSRWQFFNPFFFLPIYRKEHAMISTRSLQESLARFLEQEQPETIVCHSLGTWFLLMTMSEFSLPASVRRIVFNQSDTPEPFLKAMADKLPIPLVNVYCPWDLSLLASWLLSGTRRVGLCRIQHPHIQNRLFPLWRPFNFHLSALRDQKFVDFILGL